VRSRILASGIVLLLVVGVGTPLAWGLVGRDEPTAPEVTVAPGRDTFNVLAPGAAGPLVMAFVATPQFPFFEWEGQHRETVTGAPGALLPLPGGAQLRVPDAGRLRVAFVGDTGADAEAQKVLGQVAKATPDLVVHMGDVSYAAGDEATWDQWIRDVTTALPGVPVAYATGNHDLMTPLDEREMAMLRGDAAYYSFDVGPVHFVALDSNHVDDVQKEWLQRDLDAAQKAGDHWIVPFEHHPWYSTGTTHGSNLDARNEFASLFASHGVKLAVSGHEHNYERTQPSDGVVYVVTGGGGAPLYNDFGPTAPGSVVRQVSHEFVLVDFTATSATAVVRNAEGVVIDSFSVS
jgi:predicted phosphodiesterase